MNPFSLPRYIATDALGDYLHGLVVENPLYNHFNHYTSNLYIGVDYVTINEEEQYLVDMSLHIEPERYETDQDTIIFPLGKTAPFKFDDNFFSDENLAKVNTLISNGLKKLQTMHKGNNVRAFNNRAK